jgi:hypothetical protein
VLSFLTLFAGIIPIPNIEHLIRLLWFFIELCTVITVLNTVGVFFGYQMIVKDTVQMVAVMLKATLWSIYNTIIWAITNNPATQNVFVPILREMGFFEFYKWMCSGFDSVSMVWTTLVSWGKTTQNARNTMSSMTSMFMSSAETVTETAASIVDVEPIGTKITNVAYNAIGSVSEQASNMYSSMGSVSERASNIYNSMGSVSERASNMYNSMGSVSEKASGAYKSVTGFFSWGGGRTQQLVKMDAFKGIVSSGAFRKYEESVVLHKNLIDSILQILQVNTVGVMSPSILHYFDNDESHEIGINLKKRIITITNVLTTGDYERIVTRINVGVRSPWSLNSPNRVTRLRSRSRKVDKKGDRKSGVSRSNRKIREKKQ